MRPQRAQIGTFLRVLQVVTYGLCFSALTVSAQTPEQEQLLTIKVIKGGQEELKVTDKKNPTEFIVQVFNELELPQPGAKVIFKSRPPEGKKPTIWMEGGKIEVPVITDEDGIAHVSDVIAVGRGQGGDVQINVDASFEGKAGSQSILQTVTPLNIYEGHKKLWWAGMGGTAVTLILVFKPGPPTGTLGDATSNAAK